MNSITDERWRVKPVLERARQLLSELTVLHVGNIKAPKSRRREEDTQQLQLFVDPSQVLVRQLREANLDALTPMRAFDLLRKLKADLG